MGSSDFFNFLGTCGGVKALASQIDNQPETGICATHILARESTSMYPPKQECLIPLTKGSGIELWVNTFDWKYLSVYSLLFFVFGVKLPFVKPCSLEETG